MSNFLNDLPDDEVGLRAFDLFCTPRARDLSAKSLRLLDDAARERLTHRQILSWPPNDDAPAIDLQAFIWESHHAQAAPRTALLLHGWELQSGRMAAFVEPLRAAGWRVVALDMPAHGQSEGERTTLLDWSAAVRGAAERFDSQLVLAHSFGATAAAWTMAHGGAPSAERFVILASSIDVEFLVDYSPRFEGVDERVRRAFEAEFEKRMSWRLREFGVAAAASHIQAATLVVHDESDTFVPFEHGRRFARSIPQARMLATHGLGHLGILRDPSIIDAVVAFAG